MILDTRGREESAEQLVEDISKEIAKAGVEVLKVESLGRRDFARHPDPRITAGNYVQFDLAGPPDTVDRIRTQFRHNPVLFRLIIQSI